MLGRIESAWRHVRRKLDRRTWLVRLFGLRRDPAVIGDAAAAAHRDGLVLVQIDGLGLDVLERALAAGEMPFLSRLIMREHYQVTPLYSGLPSSTPAVQGELFYGVRGAVPAFAFLDRSSGRVRRMYEPSSALGVERTLQEGNEGLLTGGSAWCDIYIGGASESHFCAASLGFDRMLAGIRPLAWSVAMLAYAPLLLRAIAQALLELVLATHDAILGIRAGFSPRAEWRFVPARVAVCSLLRDIITIGASVDIERGLPIVHLNYLGFDEQAHRRGPDSRFARRTLRGIDRSIARLWQAADRGYLRHYDLWIHSDHGQEATLPWPRLHDRLLEEAIAQVLGVPRVASLDERLDTQRAELLGGQHLVRLFARRRPRPRAGTASDASRSARRVEPLLVAMGPVGHLYLEPDSSRDRAMLARRLVDELGVPAVAWRTGQGRVLVRHAGSTRPLPERARSMFGTHHPHPDAAAVDLVALVSHPHAGELVLLGCVEGTPAVSFANENGAHAGAGARENAAFALLPDDVPRHVACGTSWRPSDLRRAALDHLGRLPNGVAVEPRVEQSCSLRVVCWNVHACIGMDGRRSIERIARVIASCRPDVVALQELDVGRARSQHHDQAALIAQRLGMQHRFHPAVHTGEERYGDAILTRFPVMNARVGVLPGPSGRRGVEPRGALRLSLDVHGRVVHVLNTHFGLSRSERLAQADALLSDEWLADPDCTGFTVLCGDLNATPSSPTLQRLTTALRDAPAAAGAAHATFPSRMPRLRIDHVLVSESVRVRSSRVLATARARVASDHLPLVVDLELLRDLVP